MGSNTLLQVGLRWDLPNTFPTTVDSSKVPGDQLIKSLALGPGRTEKAKGSFVFFEVKGRVDRPLW